VVGQLQFLDRGKKPSKVCGSLFDSMREGYAAGPLISRSANTTGGADQAEEAAREAD